MRVFRKDKSPVDAALLCHVRPTSAIDLIGFTAAKSLAREVSGATPPIARKKLTAAGTDDTMRFLAGFT
jgi:hypothetical protein